MESRMLELKNLLSQSLNLHSTLTSLRLDLCFAQGLGPLALSYDIPDYFN